MKKLPVKSTFNYVNNIDFINNIIKNKYILGYGGNIYEKTGYNTPDFSVKKYIYLSINNLNKITTTNQKIKISYIYQTD